MKIEWLKQKPDEPDGGCLTVIINGLSSPQSCLFARNFVSPCKHGVPTGERQHSHTKHNEIMSMYESMEGTFTIQRQGQVEV